MNTSTASRGLPPAGWLALVALSVAGGASARPAHVRTLAEYYGPVLPAGMKQCSTCHAGAAAGPPGTLAGFPHNAFGKALAALGPELQAKGARSDLGSRLRLAAAQDADGDGVPNQAELLAGSAPGDAGRRPAPAELARLPALSARLRAYQAEYRWRPFEPVTRPSVPVDAVRGWGENPIDRFVLRSLKAAGLRPSEPAPREVLLRRVYLDLIGLAPTPAERQAFLADRSAGAYEAVVDRLLSDPRHGERWGRHWMDIWRYSDWTGYGQQVRDSQPHIWRWRDWIVESLNADRPYDQMVRLMLAGDEIAPLDPDALRATGYLVRNFKLLSREKWMQDVVDHTGQAFLGLTVGCARCHDHMTDPVSQKEYYRLRAVFEPHQVRTDWVPGEADPAKSGLPRAFDAQPDAPTWLYERGDERRPIKDAALPAGVPESLGGRFQPAPVPVPYLARHPEQQPHVLAALRAEAAARLNAAVQARAAAPGPVSEQAVRAAQASVDALEAVFAVEALEAADQTQGPAWEAAAREAQRRQRSEAREAAVLSRLQAEAAMAKAGAAPAARQKAQKAVEDALAAEKKAQAELAAPPSTAFRRRSTVVVPSVSTGRRTAFANWLADRDNPLTARVAVNQIWARHFGRGLVPTVENLGRSGVQPSHPELLDWLAAEFMTPSPGSAAAPATPWSMKHLHCLIVTSAAYRQASTPTPAGLAKDPDNLRLWRFAPRRLDAELVRDNVLHVCGALDPTLGGPEIDEEKGLSVPRRSLYFRHAPEKEMVFLATFDGPNPLECYLRRETVVPQQALAMFNSELALVQARRLARELAKGSAGATDDGYVRAAYERVLTRLPRPQELRECVEFLRMRSTAAVSGTENPSDLRAGSSDPALRARENLLLVLLNHHEFVTLR